MPETRREPIVETPMQARQAERGPSILVMLLASTALAAIVLGLVWPYSFAPDAYRTPWRKSLRRPVVAGHFLFSGNVLLDLKPKKSFAT